VEDIEEYITYSFPLSRSPSFWERVAFRMLVCKAHNESLYRIGPFWACESPESHIGASCWAVDFLAPNGVPVFASANGVVVAVKLDSREGGRDERFADMANFVVIDHGGEFSQYCHLAPAVRGIFRKGPVPFVGKMVRRGECIGHVGRTGWTTIDHLHFMVFRCDGSPKGFNSVRVRFSRY